MGVAGLVTCHIGNAQSSLQTFSSFRLPGSAPTPPPQNAGSNSTKPAASVFNTTITSTFQGGAEDDMDDEKPGPSSSAKEA